MQKTDTTKIDLLMKVLNVTQAEFASQLGVTSNAVTNFKKRQLGMGVIRKICAAYPTVNKEWLMTGEGDILKSLNEINEGNLIVSGEKTKPRLPINVAAGRLSEYVIGTRLSDCEQIPIVPQLPDYDFTMIIKGNSMEPKYEGGDEIACKKVIDVIEWGKTYVLDTEDGPVIKRIYDEGEYIRCVSYNSEEYPDFRIRKESIYGIYRVVGLIRI